MGGAKFGQVGLGCIKKEAEQAGGSKAVSSIPPYLLQLLSSGPVPGFP